MQFLDIVKDRVKSDRRLSAMIFTASEYADIYFLARQRQKGCDGMGELATMKDELRDMVDKVMEHCKEKEYISDVLAYDIDLIADEIKGLRACL